MLATVMLKLFNSTMSETTGDFDPGSLDEILNLLPDRCRNCKFAEFTISLAWAFASGVGDPLSYVKQIRDECSGYEGEARPLGMEVLDTSDGPRLFSPFPDESGCPYSATLHEMNEDDF